MFAKFKKKLETESKDEKIISDNQNPTVCMPRQVRLHSDSSQSSDESLVDFSVANNNNGHDSHEQEAPPIESELDLRKIDWQLKFENLRKSFEKELREQEENFAWTCRSKDNDLILLKNERDDLKQKVETMDSNWQSKFKRVSSDLEQLVEFSRIENVKVKHLLINTQAELQTANIRIAELESKLKNNYDNFQIEESSRLVQQEFEIAALRKELESIKIL